MRPRRIEIPQRLVETLDRDAALAGAVRTALAEFEPWLEDNKLVFFPEYTDHGPDHIRQVLDTASSLIADAAWPILSAADIAALVLSTLLHDCAMHLSEDGFIALVTGRQPDAVQGEAPWPELWQQFLGEASRFDGRKLVSLFGSAQRVLAPPLDGSAMSRTDRLLIGEFLRRHHARLAHEIAIAGVPGPGTERLSFHAVPSWLAGLSGLIARSHGMSIRAAAECLPSFKRRVHRDVHAPFIMAVLRIADYLQVHAERAPAALLHVRGLTSPVSRGEWAMHAIIETIHAYDDDPEALFIAARPRSAAEFTKAHALFESIQRELDETWALLGEVYGRVQGLDRLGLTLRRIKSNLDDREAFARTVDFVPVAASFTSAGGELLKLLVGPLYNNDPNIAVRELLQNAVDAVMELRDYLAAENRQPAATDAHVVIALDAHEGGGNLTVTDHGIGMTADTIVNYFLRAGASFRNSDDWQKHHMSGADVHIPRAGRFGIGALAAFLAGDRIHVSTRHVSAETGIEFTAGIDDGSIELKRIAGDVGTTIRVDLRPEVADAFREPNTTLGWDWYCLSDPVVKRFHNGRQLEQRIAWPPVRGKLPASWRRILVPGYSDIQYMFATTDPGIVSNGIAVSRMSRALELGVRRPNLSVFDGASSLPLDLRRAQTVEPLPFANLLLEEIVRDLVVTAMTEAPEGPAQLMGAWRFFHPALHDSQDPFQGWLFWAPSGWALTHMSSLRELQTDRIIVANDFEAAAAKVDPRTHAVIGMKALDNVRSLMGALVTPNSPWWNGVSAARLLVPQLKVPTEKLLQSILPEVRVQELGRQWAILQWGDYFQPSLDLEGIAAQSKPNLLQGRFIGEVIPRKATEWDHHLYFVRRWREMLPGGSIPPSRAARRQLHHRLAESQRSVDAQ